MTDKFMSLGFGSFIAADRVLMVLNPDSAPVKRMIQQYRDRDRLIDATYGRRTRAVLLLDDGTAVLAALLPATLLKRTGNDVREEG